MKSKERSDKYVPIKIGSEYDVEIHAIGKKGDGIAQVEGFVVIVSGVQKGDKVLVRITNIINKCGFGEVVN